MESAKRYSLKKLIIFIFLFFATTICRSQVTVTGKVIFKEDNSEAPGVNVIEKETKNGT